MVWCTVYLWRSSIVWVYERTFLSLKATVNTWDRWYWTHWQVCHRMVGVIEMSSDKFVNIIVLYKEKMFGKPVRETSCSFTGIHHSTFITGNAINDVGGSARKTSSDNVIEFGVRNNRVCFEESTSRETVSWARKCPRWLRWFLFEGAVQLAELYVFLQRIERNGV